MPFHLDGHPAVILLEALPQLSLSLVPLQSCTVCCLQALSEQTERHDSIEAPVLMALARKG